MQFSESSESDEESDEEEEKQPRRQEAPNQCFELNLSDDDSEGNSASKGPLMLDADEIVIRKTSVCEKIF